MSDVFRNVSDLLPKVIAVWDAKRESPYVLDLIEVLLPGGSEGVQRASALRTMESTRRTKGLPIPDRFEEAVQGEFNRHSTTSTVFKKRGVPADGLFSSRLVGNTAFWAVDPERALVWLAVRVLDPAAIMGQVRGPGGHSPSTAA